MKHRQKMELKSWEKEKKKLQKAAKKSKSKLAEIEEKERLMLERHAKELQEAGVEEVAAEEEAEVKQQQQQQEVAAPVKTKKSKAEKRREKKLREEEQFAASFDAQSLEGPRAEEIKKLEEKMQQLRLQVREVPPDGHCLFNAVGDQLADGRDHKQLRALAADYMQEHEDEFKPFLGEEVDYSQYLQRIRTTAEWGGQLELSALAKGLSRCIMVHSADAPVLRINEEALSDDKPALQLTYHRHFISTGEHYNSAHPQQQ